MDHGVWCGGRWVDGDDLVGGGCFMVKMRDESECCSDIWVLCSKKSLYFDQKKSHCDYTHLNELAYFCLLH